MTMKISCGVKPEPQRIVCYGPEGIGKSSLAAKMPRPVFVDVEGSTSDLDVARTPEPTSWKALVDLVAEFATDHHGYRTLVIDTADWAEKLCIAHVCAANHMTALGGQDDFGRSYNLLDTEWRRFLDALSRVAVSRMHVCLLAHTGVKHFRQPDLADGYERWELKMERKTAAATKEWARTVLFLNYKTYVVENKGKPRGTGGHRVMYSTHNPAWDAKNRADLPEEMKLDYSEIARLFSYTESPTAASGAARPMPEALSSAEPQPREKTPQPVKPEGGNESGNANAPAVPPPADPVPSTTGGNGSGQAAVFLKPLSDLMQRDGVTEREIQLAVHKRGYYPVDTPLENYDPQFVAGKLVAHWDAVKGIVQEVRKEAAV